MTGLESDIVRVSIRAHSFSDFIILSKFYKLYPYGINIAHYETIFQKNRRLGFFVRWIKITREEDRVRKMIFVPGMILSGDNPPGPVFLWDEDQSFGCGTQPMIEERMESECSRQDSR